MAKRMTRMGKFSFKRSLELYEEALKYIPAGVGSNARLWRTPLCRPGLPCSLFVKKAEGSHMWDVDGNEYIDYRLGYGPVILGHNYPKVTEAAHRAEKLGAVYAAGHELEIDVAKLLMRFVPCAEMIRYASTGTEATMAAVRVARAYTKRDKVLKFEGHFHGTHDYVLWSTEPPFTWPKRPFDQRPQPQSTGIPKAIKQTVLVERWNDFEAIERTVKKHRKELAAIITEPIMGNAAAIMPQKGYLKHLRELCEKYGVVLIFDEVKTGFRVAPGGAQELFKVKPDLACFAKAMGNGYPVSALVGKRELMEQIRPKGVSQGGTYSSNPVSLAAVHATLTEMRGGRVHRKINSYGKRMMRGIDHILSDHNIPHLMNGVPGMFQVIFTQLSEVKEWRDLEHAELRMYPELQIELMKNGILTDHDIEEPLFISYSHSEKDLKWTLENYWPCCSMALEKIKTKLEGGGQRRRGHATHALRPVMHQR